MPKERTVDLALVIIILGVLVYFWKEIASIFTSGTTANNFVTNALTGSLTVSQQSQLVDAETAQLIKAGADPATAKAQATADVSTAVSTGTVSYGSALWTTITSPAQALRSIFGG